MEAGTAADSTATAPSDEDDVIFPQSDEKLKEMTRL